MTEQAFLDDDDLPDRLVRVGDDRPGEWEVLAFVQRARGWKFVGAVPVGGDRVLLSTAQSRGRRWLRAEFASGWAAADVRRLSVWYRVTGDQLRLVQAVPTAARSNIRSGFLWSELSAEGEPELVRVRGRDAARCRLRGRIVLSVWYQPHSRRLELTLWEDDGPFDFALDGGERAIGAPLGASPWGERTIDWLLHSDAVEVLLGCADSLRRLAAASPDAKQAICGYLSTFENEPELARLRQELLELP